MEKSFFEQTYFELFSLPVSFSIDVVKLEATYNNLQSLIHPDRFATKTDLEKRMAMQMAVQVNTAYKCLLQALTRAVYILKLKGIELDFEHQTSHDLDFLQLQMSWRERMHQQDESLAAEIEKVYADYFNVIDETFVENNDTNMKDLTKKIFEFKFIDKIRQELKAKM